MARRRTGVRAVAARERAPVARAARRVTAPMPWIDANGISIRYNIAGHGAPIVLFHELGGCVESWASVVHYLSPDFTTLSYDQRGAGLSEKVREPFTFDTLVADFEALIGALDVSPPFHLRSE